MVEMALGLLVFITILVFGIHFAEIGYLSLKVTEANASALWHATAAKGHTLPADFSDIDNLISNDMPGSTTTGLYSDFDGRTSTTGGSESVQVFTKAQGLKVTCEKGGPSFKPVGTTEGVFKDTGGMVCHSEAVFQVMPIFPREFMDNGSGAFFQKKHYDANDLTICGTGRAKGGCKGNFAILLDDWGLETGQETKECPVKQGSGCPNKPYYKSTELVYREHVQVDGSSLSLAEQVTQQNPGFDPGTFYHSFKVYTDDVPSGEGDTTWETTPGQNSPTQGYDPSYQKREDCWLGVKCP